MNNNAIPQSSTAPSLYVAHSVKQKTAKKEPIKETSKTEAPSHKAQPYQYISRSYYYDSTGGGYQGL